MGEQAPEVHEAPLLGFCDAQFVFSISNGKVTFNDQLSPEEGSEQAWKILMDMAERHNASSLAHVAVMLEKAAGRCDVWHQKALERSESDVSDSERHEECAATSGSLAAEIRALIPADAQAALDEYVRHKAVDVEAKLAKSPAHFVSIKEWEGYKNGVQDAVDAIREAGHE